MAAVPSNGSSAAITGVDHRAREMAMAATSEVKALRDLFTERERSNERFLQQMQATYREGFTNQQRHTAEALEQITKALAEHRFEFDRELRDLALSTDKRIGDHLSEDDERFKAIDGWRWKIVWGVIVFLSTCTLGLIGAVWAMVPHAPL